MYITLDGNMVSEWSLHTLWKFNPFQALQDPIEAFICWRKIKELTIGSLHVI